MLTSVLHQLFLVLPSHCCKEEQISPKTSLGVSSTCYEPFNCYFIFILNTDAVFTIRLLLISVNRKRLMPSWISFHICFLLIVLDILVCTNNCFWLIGIYSDCHWRENNSCCWDLWVNQITHVMTGVFISSESFVFSFLYWNQFLSYFLL